MNISAAKGESAPPFDVIKDEWMKCANDIFYFIENYGYVRTQEKGIVKFQLFDYQKEIIQHILDPNHKCLAILKARQLGVSTVMAAFIAWYLLFRKDRHIFIMATKHEKASIMFEMTKTFMEECPSWLNLWKKKKDNTKILWLSNGSWVRAVPTSKDVGRGDAASLYVIDEAAIIDKLSDYWTGLWPALSCGGKSVMVSTPNGAFGKFYEVCQNGARLIDGKWIGGISNNNVVWKVLEYPWYRRYDQQWFSAQTSELSPRQIAQEYECKFIESGDTFLESKIMDQIKNSLEEPLYKPQKSLWIWNDPIEDHCYSVSADVARGDSNDYSTFYVLDLNNCEIVAEYKDHIKTNDFAKILVQYAVKYNGAIIIPEANTYGNAVIQEILNCEYDNLYYTLGMMFIDRWDAINKKARPGFNTTAKSRPLMLNKMEEYIRLDKIKIKSRRLYEEFTTFVWKDGRAQAPRRKSDDLILALAIGIYTYEQMSSKIGQTGGDVAMDSMGFQSNKTTLQMGNNDHSDLSALLSMMISRG